MPLRVWLNLPIIASVFAVALRLAPLAFGQSGSRNTISSPAAAANGSVSSIPEDRTSRHATNLPVGLQGYCPVCLVEMRQWIKGNARFAIELDGKGYLFPGPEQAEKFKKNPLKYVPILAGDDVVHFARTGRRAEGRLTYGVLHKGRTYFFTSAENKQLFQSMPERYADANLALGGECVVCRLDMNRRVPGSPEFTVVYLGLRYQFPGDEKKAAFLKSPARYVEAPSTRQEHPTAGSVYRPATAPQQPNAGSGGR